MMNLKYYLRGLGIGVIVTALIMGITAGRKKETLSNEEIKQRAAALGMVEESQVLADMLGEKGDASDVDDGEIVIASAEPSALPEIPEEEAEPSATPEIPEEENDGDETNDQEDTASGEESADSAEDAGQTQDESGAVLTGESVTIQVESGEGSFIVCQKLEDAGLVPLASEFDRYLYDNGYDKRINIGTYEIPVGAGFEEIARIIAKIN